MEGALGHDSTSTPQKSNFTLNIRQSISHPCSAVVGAMAGWLRRRTTDTKMTDSSFNHTLEEFRRSSSDLLHLIQV